MMIESKINVIHYHRGMRLQHYFDYAKYPNGEWNIKYLDTQPRGETFDIPDEMIISINIVRHDDFFKLAIVKNILEQRHRNNVKYILKIYYAMYGRQDRVFDIYNNVQSMPQYVFADFINNMKFNEVILIHPHSDSLNLLINNCRIEYPIQYAKMINQYDAIISPDLGSAKLLSQISKYFKKDLLVFHKERCIKTGSITNIKLVESNYIFKGFDHLIIIDDLCDGGATFVSLANHELFKQNNCKIDLYVCHGLFTKGIHTVFNRSIYNIFTQDLDEIKLVKNGAME